MTSKTAARKTAASKRSVSAKRKAESDDALNRDSVAAEPSDVTSGSVSASTEDTTAYDNRTDEGQEGNVQAADDMGRPTDLNVADLTDVRSRVDDDPSNKHVDNHGTAAENSVAPATPAETANDTEANRLAAQPTEDGPTVPAPVWTGQNLIYNPDSPVPASPFADPPPMIYDPPASSLPPGRTMPRADVITNPPAVGEQIGKSTAVAALEASDDFVSPDNPRPSVAELSAEANR